ncbi:unnamed protein product [Haemonchus placei]|uniref:Uncharacterized protein n=1 Tax=Haemonchus placei TaxID=6290 RepID=A0A0N4WA02_HAEPC|nr:unnamed protein product [Haemonchus placei]
MNYYRVCSLQRHRRNGEHQLKYHNNFHSLDFLLLHDRNAWLLRHQPYHHVEPATLESQECSR